MTVQLCARTWLASALLCALAVIAGKPAFAADPAADEAADQQILGTARQALANHEYQRAAERYREFLQKHARRAEAPAVRLALARIFAEGPQRDYPAALEQLAPLRTDKEFNDRPHAWYLTGVAQRAMGEQQWQQSVAKPEVAEPREAAKRFFQQAKTSFGTAASAFAARAGNSMQSPADQPLPDDLEWAFHAKCDQAELMLRLNSPPEALAALTAILDHPRLAVSRYRKLAHYHRGHAAYLLNDPATAFQDLAQLAPFNDPVIGLHARFLLARLHDQAEERPEAALHYEAVVTGFENDKKLAPERLRDPNQLKDNPEERVRLEMLLRNPRPEYVARAEMNLGYLAFADGRYNEAIARLTAFTKANPPPTKDLLWNAQLHIGMSQVQAKQYVEAVKSLNGLLDKPVGEAAHTWMARAYLLASDPKKGNTYQQDVATAIESFQVAIKLIGKPANDAAAQRLAGLRQELADAYVLGKKPKEAIAILRDLVRKSAGLTREQLTIKLAAALASAGDFEESEGLCRLFEMTAPRSALLADVAYLSAQNALQQVQQALKEKQPDVKRQQADVAKRLQLILEKYPEFPQIDQVRYELGQTYYQLGKYPECAEALAGLADADRVGPLAMASYIQADALLRGLPTDTNDALAAGRALETMADAVKQLNKFTSGPANDPLMPEAMLKLASVQIDAAALLVEPQEKNNELNAAQQTLDKFSQTYQQHPLRAQMYLERSRRKAIAGDLGGAISDLAKFQGDPYRSSPLAPIAFIRLAGYHRQQNRHDEALKTISQCLDTYEAKSLGADWVPTAYYLRGVALLDLNKPALARASLAKLLQKFPNSPAAADGLWRLAQCLRQELPPVWEKSRRAWEDANLKPEEREPLAKTLKDLLAELDNAAERCETAAQAVRGENVPEATQRQYYEAAWARRALAQIERDIARLEFVRAESQHLREELAKRLPAGQNAPEVRPPDSALAKLPRPASAAKAAASYLALIQAAPNAPLTVDARLELAEILLDEGKPDDALRLAQDALDNDPNPVTADKLLVVLGSCLLAKRDFTAAADKFTPLMNNAQSPLSPNARYRLGEAHFQQENWPKVVELLLPFRDHGQFHNISGVSEHALFRLGLAQFQLKDWDQVKNTLEAYVNRFGNAAGRDEARYLIGKARQEQRQFDDAVNWYQQVGQRVAGPIGAKCILAAGQCRLEQKRGPEALALFTTAAAWTDDEELQAEALFHTALAHRELKNDDAAAKALQTVIEKYPRSPVAKQAEQQLKK